MVLRGYYQGFPPFRPSRTSAALDLLGVALAVIGMSASLVLGALSAVRTGGIRDLAGTYRPAFIVMAGAGDSA